MTKSERIALIGYKGFVGRALFEKLKENRHDVTGVSRDNYESNKKQEFGTLINSAMPSKRYWALENPMQDFDATVRLTADLVYGWKWKKFVQVSTVSARCQLDHPYGINKLCAETLVLNRSKSSLVFRLGALFGEGLDKGVIFDMLKGNKIFLSGNSRYNYISTGKASEIMAKKIGEKGIIEVGAKDQISLKEISDNLNLDVEFGDRLESQHTENPDDDYPESKEILKFMSNIKEEKNE